MRRCSECSVVRQSIKVGAVLTCHHYIKYSCQNEWEWISFHPCPHRRTALLLSRLHKVELRLILTEGKRLFSIEPPSAITPSKTSKSSSFCVESNVAVCGTVDPKKKMLFNADMGGLPESHKLSRLIVTRSKGGGWCKWKQVKNEWVAPRNYARVEVKVTP